MFENRRYGKSVRFRVTESMSKSDAASIAADIRKFHNCGANVDTWKGRYAVWADKKIVVQGRIAVGTVAEPFKPLTVIGAGKVVTRKGQKFVTRVINGTTIFSEMDVQGVGAVLKFVTPIKEEAYDRAGSFNDNKSIIAHYPDIKLYSVYRLRTGKSRRSKGKYPKRASQRLGSTQSRKKSGRPSFKSERLTDSHPIGPLSWLMINTEGTSRKFWGFLESGNTELRVMWGSLKANKYSYQELRFDNEEDREDFEHKMIVEKKAKGYKVVSKRRYSDALKMAGL